MLLSSTNGLFINMIEFSDQKYQTSGFVRDEKYKEKFLFSMKDFLKFGIDHQSMFLCQLYS